MNKLFAIAFAVIVFNVIFFSRGIPFPGTYGSALLILSINAFTTIIFTPKLFKKTQPNPDKPLESTPRSNFKLVGVSFAVTAVATLLSLLRGSEIDRLILSATALTSSALSFYLLAKPTAQILALSELVFFPLRLLARLFPSIDQALNSLVRLGKAFSSKQTSTESTKTDLKLGSFIRGGIITSIVLFLIISLLSVGDAAFENFLGEILKIELNFDWLDRLLASLVITAMASAISYVRITRPYRSPLAGSEYQKHTVELYMLVTSVLGVMALFLVIQAPYLFTSVAETQLHRFGINTYSEYVRRGFVELSLVSAIIYGVTALSYLVIRTRTLVQDWLKWLTISLLSIDLIFIASIFRRLFLYSDSHGLTLARIYGIVFLLAVIGWTLTLMGRLTFPKRFIWHYLEAGVLILAIFLPSLINPEKIIVRYAPPTVNEQIDYTYFARLSSDGVEGWLSAYADTQDWLASHQQFFADTILTDNEYRELQYHLQVIAALGRKYDHLARIYGNPETVDLTCRTLTYYDNCTSAKVDPQANYHTNLSEKAAYTWLKAKVKPEELIAQQSWLTDFLTQVNQARQAPPPNLDRSSQSPLVQ